MGRFETVINRQCELTATRIQIAELEREILREVRAQRHAAADVRRQSLEAAAAEVKRLEQAVEAETAATAAEKPARGSTHYHDAVVGAGLAARQTAVPSPEPARTANPVPVNPQEIWPTGSDLAKPKTFGSKPPVGDLESNGSNRDEYHRRLSQHLDFATKVLHTSGVIAVVWREWRAFERLVQEKLRTLNAAPSA